MIVGIIEIWRDESKAQKLFRMNLEKKERFKKIRGKESVIKMKHQRRSRQQFQRKEFPRH